MSKSILKLVDYSLFPSFLLIFTKLISVFLLLRAEGINITVGEFLNDSFQISPELPAETIMNINSISDLVMFLAIATYFSIILVRATFFHDSHLKPTLMTKLIDKNLFNLVRTSYEIYHEAFVGLIFLWISNFVIFINLILIQSESWVLAVSLFFSVLLTVGLFWDIYKEIETIKSKPGNYKWKIA